jgi:3-hydroxyacyl-[acyl-carrier-protein] dehydratase
MILDEIARPATASISFEELRALLPQSFPFLMVDRVLSWDAGERITTIKNVTGNEAHFPGHFPGRAIMPGVLIIEAMAQSIGLLSALSSPHKSQRPGIGYLANANVSFHKPVVPGDQLRIDAALVRTVGKLQVAKVKARVSELVARGEIVVAAAQE